MKQNYPDSLFGSLSCMNGQPSIFNKMVEMYVLNTSIESKKIIESSDSYQLSFLSADFHYAILEVLLSPKSKIAGVLVSCSEWGLVETVFS